MQKVRERIFIVPTWSGLVLATAIVILFGIGYLTRGFGGPVQVLVMCLVVAGIVSLILTNDNLRGVEIRSCRSQPTPAGAPVTLEVTVTNSSPDERLGLLVRWQKGWKLEGTTQIPILPPHSTRTVQVLLPAKTRGIYEIPPLAISSRQPIGLCFAWKIFRETGTYVVYPRGESRRPLPMGEMEEGRLRREGHEDIEGHRPYIPGDSPSRINWRVYARTNRTVVGTYEGGGSEQNRFTWEDTAFLKETEDRLEQFSAWVSECLRKNRPFLCTLPSGTFRQKDVTACRTALAAFPKDSPTA